MFRSRSLPFPPFSRMSMVALLAATTLGVCAGSRPAAAVDVVNQDGSAYEVVLEENGETNRFVIAPRSTLSDVCQVCIVRVSASAPVPAEENDVITIRQAVASVGG